MPNGSVLGIGAFINAAYFYQAVILSLEELVNDVHTAIMGQSQGKEICHEWKGKQGFKEDTGI